MDKSFNLHPFLSTGPAGCYSLHVQLLFVQSICFQGYIYGWELMSLVSVATMETMAAVLNGSRCSGFYCHSFVKDLRTSWPKTFPSPRMSEDFSFNGLISGSAISNSSSITSLWGGRLIKKNGINALSPDITAAILTPEFLDACDDEYDGVIIDPECLPSSANAFVSALHASLSSWKLKGKKGVWLKILSEKADLVPIAIKEGFSYHHAEPGYVIPSHQIGVGGFVMNDKREVLVVKEKCPCRCSDVWKIPTGYINKSEDIFSAATREVKEETGVDTTFLEMVAFRHAHLVAFEKSDLLFVCMLKPLSTEITIDEKEIQAAKWMRVEEFVEQPFYVEDHMSRKFIDICIKAYEHRHNGFTAHQLTSKLDGKLSYLYYNELNKI
ncbi:Nudix hydrolase [Melia azedarach]|uniref:Nudix hydrolase n=1 Tax=Melia azedarach TaxID=155640 RepID=A0ACC1XBK5_MELAZ|nr:Nudix hydrolase [Melia azedarach]